MPYAGEIAALATSACWTGSALCFDASARRIGSLSLNLLRLGLGFAYLCLTATVYLGQPLPLSAPAESWAWLSLSGLVGFTFGDLCLFRSFLLLGPRLAMLVMALSPVMAAALGFVVLGEALDLSDLAGMAVAVSGVAWVVAERRAPDEAGRVRDLPRGLLLALGGALGQAGGLVLSKMGMGDLNPVAATQIRAIAGMGGFALVYVALGWWPAFLRALRDRKAVGFAAAGAAFGPFIGVSLSLYAVQHAQVGVAATLMALPPVFILPFAVLILRERVTWRAAAGALVAVAGVALLFG